MNQNKKCSNLSEINNKLTEEVLTSILSKTYNGKEVQLTDWNFKEGSTKGDNYLSNVYKGRVNGIINGDPKQHMEINIVVKSMPKNPGTRKSFRSADFFSNEITFYTKIIPKFEKFIANKGQSDLLHIPCYLASFTDNENDFIILEDASYLGFYNISRQHTLDWMECTSILKTLAKFHAISFAYKDQKKEEFAELVDSLKETIFSSNYWHWYKGFHEKVQVAVRQALATEYPNGKAEKRYNSYKLGVLFDKCIELCERKIAPTSVITQGDCWIPNFLLRDIGSNRKESMMLDFQLARCVSPILDLSDLIYSCTDKSFRDQYFDDALKFYHSELSSTIKSLGSNSEKIYPWKLFMKEVQEQFVFGIFQALDAIPIVLMPVSESFSIETAVEGDEAVDVSDAIKAMNFNITTASGRQRIADVIIHGIERGYL